MNVKKIGIIGAGTMGHGIALVSAQAGFEVVLRDTTQELVERGITMNNTMKLKQEKI